MTKIRTPSRTVKTLKIMLDNQETGMYNYTLSQLLGVRESDVYPNLKKMLEDDLIYLDQEVLTNYVSPRKYYKICEDKIPFVKHMIRQEVDFWTSNFRQ